MYLTLLRRYYIFIAVLAVFFFMIILKGDIFLSEYNIRSVARELSFIGIISCGVCLLMTMGHFDLSVGVVFTMGAVLSAMLVKSEFINLAWINPLIFGLVIGLVNGLLVSYLRSHSFLITLGTTYLINGIVLLLTDGHAISNLSRDFSQIGKGIIFNIPIPTIIFVIVSVISWIVLTKTKFGNNLFAIGSNRNSAVAMGINVKYITIYGFLITGFLSSLSGILYASRLASASPLAGIGFDLDSIAVVVLGGTRLFGGYGTITGTILGVILFALIVNGLNLFLIQPYALYIVKGIIVSLAVSLNIWISNYKNNFI